MKKNKVIKAFRNWILIIGLSVGAFGFTNASPTFTEVTLSEKIESLIEFPDIALENFQEAYVIVVFRIEASGDIHVVQTESPDAAFEDHVKQTLESSVIEVPEAFTNTNYILRINFKLSH